MGDPLPVVLLEDDEHIADLVSLYLEQSGFRVYRADNGGDGLRIIGERQPKVVILDIGLAGTVDGLDVCRQLRVTTDVPVIFLTARDGEIDRVLGLELGADDYVTKPFSPAELVARVKAVLRRADGTAASSEVLQAGNVTIDIGRREVVIDGEVVPFTTKEFDLLRFLAERPGLALSRQQILDGVWGYDWFGDVRTVDVHIAQVRKKIGDAVQISTVRGIGYRMDSNTSARSS